MPTDERDGYLRKVLGKEERILFVVRQHWIFLFGRLFGWIVLALIIFGGVTAGAVFAGDVRVLAAYVLLLIPLLRMGWAYLVWTNHKCVVTTRRVLQMDGVLSKEVVDALLDQVNDVKTEQSLLGRMFDYGDVEILTANEVGNNVFRHIAHPLRCKTMMLDAKQALDTAGVKS